MASPPLPGGSVSRPLSDLQRRVRLACNHCRNRKTRCDGNQPCRTCSVLTTPPVQCIYADTGKKRMVPQAYINGLKARVRMLESRLEEVCDPDGVDEPTPTDSALINMNPLADGIADFTLTATGHRQYLGPSSSTSWGIRFREFLRPRLVNISGDIEFDPPEAKVTLPCRRPSVSALPDLPPPEVGRSLFSAQHAYIGSIFAFLEPATFEERLQRIYAGDIDTNDREDCLTICQVLTIFAYGQMYSINQWMSRDGPPGYNYFIQALEFLPDIHEEASVTFVEVLALIGYFMQILNRRDAAFTYTGIALRMAINLGLHEEVDDPTLDDVAREHRRRIWWSVYSMDHILCAKSGNPISIADEDISVLPPASLPTEPAISSATILLHYTALSRILGRIAKTMYRKTPKTSTGLVKAVQGIMKDLATWSRELPTPLRFDFSQLDRDIERESVSMFLHYYQCVNMTARPLLFNVVQKRLLGELSGPQWTTGLSPTTIKVIEACIAAAKDTATIMRKAAKQNLVATYGFMDGEHIFSAAMVLVMINIAFPPNSSNHHSMEAAIAVIKFMGDRGNENMKARHQFILDLCAMIPGAQAQPQAATQALPSTSEVTKDNFTVGVSPGAQFPVLDTTDDMGDILTTDINVGDQILWEEGYGNLDLSIGLDFDWSQWSETMRQQTVQTP